MQRINALANNAMGETQYPIGSGDTYLKGRPGGGITIGKGQARIKLDADETAQLIKTAQELTK
jgi:hypothetical protein